MVAAARGNLFPLPSTGRPMARKQVRMNMKREHEIETEGVCGGEYHLEEIKSAMFGRRFSMGSGNGKGNGYNSNNNGNSSYDNPGFLRSSGTASILTAGLRESIRWVQDSMHLPQCYAGELAYPTSSRYADGSDMDSIPAYVSSTQGPNKEHIRFGQNFLSNRDAQRDKRQNYLIA